jgi:hypothetical protein
VHVESKKSDVVQYLFYASYSFIATPGVLVIEMLLQRWNKFICDVHHHVSCIFIIAPLANRWLTWISNGSSIWGSNLIDQIDSFNELATFDELFVILQTFIYIYKEECLSVRYLLRHHTSKYNQTFQKYSPHPGEGRRLLFSKKTILCLQQADICFWPIRL